MNGLSSFLFTHSPAWLWEGCCQGHCLLVAGHVAGQISEEFAGYPLRWDTQQRCQDRIEAILAQYPDRHFDYVIHIDPPAGAVRLRRRHVDMPCPWHTDELDESGQRYRWLWEDGQP